MRPSHCGKVTKYLFILEALLLAIPVVPAPTKTLEKGRGQHRKMNEADCAAASSHSPAYCCLVLFSLLSSKVAFFLNYFPRCSLEVKFDAKCGSFLMFPTPFLNMLFGSFYRTGEGAANDSGQLAADGWNILYGRSISGS